MFGEGGGMCVGEGLWVLGVGDGTEEGRDVREGQMGGKEGDGKIRGKKEVM